MMIDSPNQLDDETKKQSGIVYNALSDVINIHRDVRKDDTKAFIEIFLALGFVTAELVARGSKPEAHDDIITEHFQRTRHALEFTKALHADNNKLN